MIQNSCTSMLSYNWHSESVWNIIFYMHPNDLTYWNLQTCLAHITLHYYAVRTFHSRHSKMHLHAFRRPSVKNILYVYVFNTRMSNISFSMYVTAIFSQYDVIRWCSDSSLDIFILKQCISNLEVCRPKCRWVVDLRKATWSSHNTLTNRWETKLVFVKGDYMILYSIIWSIPLIFQLGGMKRQFGRKR